MKQIRRSPAQSWLNRTVLGINFQRIHAAGVGNRNCMSKNAHLEQSPCSPRLLLGAECFPNKRLSARSVFLFSEGLLDPGEETPLSKLTCEKKAPSNRSRGLTKHTRMLLNRCIEFAPLPKTLMVTFETFLAAPVVNRCPSGRRLK